MWTFFLSNDNKDSHEVAPHREFELGQHWSSGESQDVLVKAMDAGRHRRQAIGLASGIDEESDGVTALADELHRFLPSGRDCGPEHFVRVLRDGADPGRDVHLGHGAQASEVLHLLDVARRYVHHNGERGHRGRDVRGPD